MTTLSQGEEDHTRMDYSPLKGVEAREVAVFLFLIVPSMAFSFFAVKRGSLNFPLVASSTILRDLALVSLIVYFLWRNGEPLSQIGWTVGNMGKDLIWGVAIFVPFFIGTGLLEKELQDLGFSVPATPLPFSGATKSYWDILLAFLLVTVVVFAEETIFRGYLILRFRKLTTNLSGAILLSALIFALGHGYEGSAGVITVGSMGVVFGLVYLWRGSLVAPMTIHFLQDASGILILPLLGVH